MTPTNFPQSNTRFKHHTQPLTPAYVGLLAGGEPVVVTAWMPTAAERLLIAKGEPVYLSTLGKTLPPCNLSMEFPEVEE